MIKNSQSQTGSAHIAIIIILISAILGLLGFVVWQNFIKQDVSINTDEGSVLEMPKETEQPAEDTLTYRSDVIGIEFKYPKEWIKVECDNTYVENPQNKVYFGTTNEGLGIVEGRSTPLCGDGSDFPPQMTFGIRDKASSDDVESRDSEEYYNKNAKSITEVTIDGRLAKKIVLIAGSDVIVPFAGSELTSYSINIGNGRVVGASYIRWPSQAYDSDLGGRDNSEVSRDKFINIVEKSLRFL
jgi:hypothetical protein